MWLRAYRQKWVEWLGQSEIQVQVLRLWGRVSNGPQERGIQGNRGQGGSRTLFVAWSCPNLWHQPPNGSGVDKKKARSLPDIVTTLLPAKKRDVLELDELWSFVYSKAFKRWVWIAICRRTRQIVSFFIGDRSVRTCRKFWKLIPPRYRRCRTFSDFWEAYSSVIQTGKHQSVGKESGETCHVERWNNTLRQRICRFVRKTLSFSKSDEMHELYLHLFIYNYNQSLVK